MRTNRRKFISTALTGGLAATWSHSCSGSETQEPGSGSRRPDYARLDGNGWYLYYEQYPGVRYGCSTAKKPSGPWYNLYFKEYDVPENARHGSMIPISQKQYDAIMAAYGD